MFANQIENIFKGLPLADRLAIGRQFYVSKKEEIVSEGYTDDPMGELQISSQNKSFIHKYPDKILILTTNRCPVLCRFCTRKRITFQKDNLDRDRFKDAIQYLKLHPQIKEIIFSGGDPFMVSNSGLSLLLDSFLEIDNLSIFRFHSRTLTMNPERFQPDFFKIFNKLRKKMNNILAVLHINHPAEISKKSEITIENFKKEGITLLAQTVLLRRVNDNADILSALIRKLLALGIRPYYLHQLDRISGSGHFEVPIQKGLEIMEDLKSRLPACVIPRYMQDGPEGKKEISSKIIQSIPASEFSLFSSVS